MMGMGLLLLARPAAAEFDPVVSDDLPRLVSKRAKLYPTRPCRGRGLGASAQLYPGDVVTAVALHRLSRGSPQTSPVFIEVELGGGVPQVLHIEDLSKKPLDYSYRGKQSFDAFWQGLAVDAPRLMEHYERIITRGGNRRPEVDKVRNELPGNWYRLEYLRRQLEFVRGRLFDRAYAHSDERRLIEKEKDWLPARGEAFITEYAGQLTPEKRKRMQGVYSVMNTLSNIPSFCAKITELQRVIDEAPTQGKYANLEPAHRARLQAEDIARSHTAITEVRAKVVVALSDARARLLLAGIKAR